MTSINALFTLVKIGTIFSSSPLTDQVVVFLQHECRVQNPSFFSPPFFQFWSEELVYILFYNCRWVLDAT